MALSIKTPSIQKSIFGHFVGMHLSATAGTANASGITRPAGASHLQKL
jgi:hypothetical protein